MTASGLVRDRAQCMHIVYTWTRPTARVWPKPAPAASFCPTSNLFLGSGLFDLAAADAARLRFALGTDVGGGTSFSLRVRWRTLTKWPNFRASVWPPLRAFYLATLGAARCLGLEEHVGQFNPGAEADFIALDRRATPLIAQTHRARAQSLGSVTRAR